MATETSGNSNGFLYFIVGVLLVAVAVLGFMFFNGGLPTAKSPTERAIERTADAVQPGNSIMYQPTDSADHTITVKAKDDHGNQATVTTSAPKDLVPPTVNFVPSQSGSVMTLVTSVSDPCGILYPWSVSVDGVGAGASYVDTYTVITGSAMPPGPHAFQAVVKDRCGNTKNYATTFVKTVNLPPVITNILIDNTQKKQPKFTVQCTDQEGVANVELRKNGSLLQSDSTAPYEFVVDTSTWPDGDSMLLFQCTDVLGAVSSPVSRNVTADNTGPNISTFTIYGAGLTYQVFADGVTDVHGIESVELMGGALIPHFDVTFSAPPYLYVWQWPMTSYSGPMPYWVTATDKWGNERTVTRFCQMDLSTTEPQYLVCS